MFSMCSELTSRARIPDTRIPKFMIHSIFGGNISKKIYMNVAGQNLNINDVWSVHLFVGTILSCPVRSIYLYSITGILIFINLYCSFIDTNFFFCSQLNFLPRVSWYSSGWWWILFRLNLIILMYGLNCSNSWLSYKSSWVIRIHS